MAEYRVEVTTGNLKKAGTWDHIFVTLFGSEGQSERTEFNNWGLDFMTGGVSWKLGMLSEINYFLPINRLIEILNCLVTSPVHCVYCDCNSVCII